MGRKKKPALSDLPLFRVAQEHTNKLTRLKALMALEREPLGWRGLMAVPPDSVLDRTLTAFQVHTDIPLEIPFFTVMHVISGMLLQRNVRISVRGQMLNPDLWTIVLAESGNGKTFTNTVIRESMPEELRIQQGLGEVASAAKFVEELEKFNRTLWIKDEWAQLMKAVQQQPHMCEMKEYFLKLHDGERIERKTKKAEITIDNPALTILGLTVRSTFVKNISAEDVLDGFSQRFGYVVAESDPERPMEDFPLYEYDKIVGSINRAWGDLKNLPIHEVYTVGDEGVSAFETAFKVLCGEFKKVEPSFFRRILWRSMKYSLIYHILLGKETSTIDTQDIAWAARVARMHLADVRWLLDAYGMSELEETIKRAEILKAKYAESGQEFTTRALISNIKTIRNVRDAQTILKFVE